MPRQAPTGPSVTSRAYSGPYPPAVWEVLDRVHRASVSVQSNFAREYAVEMALCASLGFVSTVAPDGRAYGTQWYITTAGLTALTNKEHMA